MKIYKYITILMIVLLGIFCGRNLGQSLAPDTFLYPSACFGLALIVWGSDYETAFRNDRWSVILKWHSDLFQINQRRNCRFEMMAPVSSKWRMAFSSKLRYDCLFDMTTRDFSPSVYYRRDSHFSCHMKRTDFQRTIGTFVKTVFCFKLSKLYHFKRIGYLLREEYWYWFRRDYSDLEPFRTIYLT